MTDLKRIILHWTAGANRASDMDRKHYHRLVEGEGTIVSGTHEISDTVISGAGWWAYSTIKEAGRAECRAELAEETARRQAALDRRAAALRVREIEIEEAAQKRTALERDLADEASKDPMADDPGLGLGSLQRLNEIR